MDKNEAVEKVAALRDDADALACIFANADANDWGHMWRFAEKLVALTNYMMIEWHLDFTCNNMEDEKSSFLLKKCIKENVAEYSLLPSLETLIESCKQCGFKDYRAREFQKDAKDKLTAIRQFYVDEYRG